MVKANLWSESVPRVELDTRGPAPARADRTTAYAARCHDLCLFSFGTYGEAWQGNRGRGSLGSRCIPLQAPRSLPPPKVYAPPRTANEGAGAVKLFEPQKTETPVGETGVS
jgi:hypothetical protein